MNADANQGTWDQLVKKNARLEDTAFVVNNNASAPKVSAVTTQLEFVKENVRLDLKALTVPNLARVEVGGRTVCRLVTVLMVANVMVLLAFADAGLEREVITAKKIALTEHTDFIVAWLAGV